MKKNSIWPFSVYIYYILMLKSMHTFISSIKECINFNGFSSKNINFPDWDSDDSFFCKKTAFESNKIDIIYNTFSKG